MVVDPKAIDTILEFNSWIIAYESVIEDFQKLIEIHGSDEYLEQRLHKLNCVYADLLVNRLDLVESKMDNNQKVSYPL